MTKINEDKQLQLLELAVDCRKALLCSDGVESDLFSTLLKQALDIFEISHQQFADYHRLSRTSVGRWIEGKNRPVKGMRKPFVSWIIRTAVNNCNDLILKERQKQIDENK